MEQEKIKAAIHLRQKQKETAVSGKKKKKKESFSFVLFVLVTVIFGRFYKATQNPHLCVASLPCLPRGFYLWEHTT